MVTRLLTAFALGSLFLTLNIASTGCVGGASLNPSQLPGGMGLSGADGNGASGSDKNKDSESDGNGGDNNGPPPGTPPSGGAAGAAGSGGGDGGGGGGGGDDNIAKGTANFQPFETGMGEDKEPKPHENAQNEDPNQNPGDQGETLENQGCEPNCSAEVSHQQYLSRPLDYNHIGNISPVLIAPVVNGNITIR